MLRNGRAENETLLRPAKYTHLNSHGDDEDHISSLASPAPPSYADTLPPNEHTHVSRAVNLKTLVIGLIVSYLCGVMTTIAVGALIVDIEHHHHDVAIAENSGSVVPYALNSYPSAGADPTNRHHKKKAMKKAMRKYHEHMHEAESAHEVDTEHSTEVGAGGYPYHVAKKSNTEHVDKCAHIYKPGVMEAGALLSVKTSMEINSAMEYVRHFNMAQKEIVIVCYKFSDVAAVEALKNAIKRGVEVFILADFVENHKKKKVVNKLARHGAHVRLFNGFAGMHKLHAKFVVIDKTIGLTGSANLSHNSAGSNMELVISLESKKGVKALRCKFWELWSYGVANPYTTEIASKTPRDENFLLE
ncbi:hypothetical protein SARC_02131 [Sphaeroforma arctica JP610]|uniref:Mitochondrial cardiolipin hydrolase n=1 Tax=Sphaeroforma arctica JP610 TaxID=667725 RepID=A0A0L0G9I3_9EUKA|nr:hypothetical protein SARC_02131 [Sphaeroforma arctica JP610]KNC85682.1 hypothetical protein SARC_02131 [Sphaeroforma arctica JP610]|eukprot:XP_014159584.1 hypothetical protein SARC_02131 [Sphaeroforma arctica JP610]